MEGCPTNERVSGLYMVLSSLIVVVMFLLSRVYVWAMRSKKKREQSELSKSFTTDAEFLELEAMLYACSSQGKSKISLSTASLSSEGSEKGACCETVVEQA